MRTSVPVALALFAASLVPASAQQGDSASTVTLRVADPLGDRCYRHAAAADTSARAMRVCDRAVAQAAERPRALYAALSNRGTVHYAAGRYAEAAGDFTLALGAYRLTAVGLTNRGFAYEQLGRDEPSWDEAARQDYRRALALDPGYEIAAVRLAELAKPRRERTPLARRVIV